MESVSAILTIKKPTHSFMLSLFWTLVALMIVGWIWTLSDLVTPNTLYVVLVLDLLVFPVIILIPLIGGGYFVEQPTR
ncbi:MAG: hypothetical protein GTN97_07135 [Nitrosopumilaceae archaeon]|nr:hypothetical protein [Nitrosopumilaceae archaeon]